MPSRIVSNWLRLTRPARSVKRSRSRVSIRETLATESFGRWRAPATGSFPARRRTVGGRRLRQYSWRRKTRWPRRMGPSPCCAKLRARRDAMRRHLAYMGSGKRFCKAASVIDVPQGAVGPPQLWPPRRPRGFGDASQIAAPAQPGQLGNQPGPIWRKVIRTTSRQPRRARLRRGRQQARLHRHTLRVLLTMASALQHLRAWTDHNPKHPRHQRGAKRCGRFRS